MLNALNDMFRSLMFIIDMLVYSLISKVYALITMIARMELFSDNAIASFANNIYVLIGVIAVFRITFSLLNVIVNPDLLIDRDKGVGKIIARLMVALVLVPIIPLMFNYAMRLQTVVVDNNIFMKLFLGKEAIEESNENAGEMLSRYAFSAFLICDVESNPSECANYKLGSRVDSLTDINARNSADDYIITYWFIFSSGAGLFILAILVSFCFDLILRVVKLGFLQVIAPLAVVSYIEPSSSKDGFFGKWLKLVKNTYLSLFMRLAALAFVVFAFALVLNDLDNGGIYGDANIFVKALLTILLIIGLIMFLKEAPKMLANLFGLEDVGMGALGKVLGTGLGLAGGVAAGGGVAGAAMGALSGFQSGSGSSSRQGGGGGILGAFGVGRDNVMKIATGDKDAKGGIGGFVEERLSGKIGSGGAKMRLKEGEKLTKQVERNNGDESVLYKNQDFKASFQKYKNAKKRKTNAQIQLSRAERDYKLGKLDHEAFEGFQRQYAQTESDYKTFETDFKEQQQFHQADTERYKAYNRYVGLTESRDGINQEVLDFKTNETPVQPKIIVPKTKYINPSEIKKQDSNPKGASQQGPGHDPTAGFKL